MNTEFFTEHLKLKNRFYRFPKCRSAFSKWFTFCVENAKESQDVEVMQNLATDAELALQVYSEKAWLWKKDFALIEQYRQSLNSVYGQIEELSNKMQEEYHLQEQKRLDEDAKTVQQENDVVLRKIKELQKKIEGVKNFEELNECITVLENLELSLDKDSFTPKQSEVYRSLSSAYTELTSEKMQVFQHEADVEYNRRVAEICKRSFDEFKEHTKQYKVIDDNFKAVFGDFYAVESNRLFVETQMLYSHVYSFIFSKLSDDEKFNLVSFALDIKK